MANLLKQGASWLNDRLAKSASENCCYFRNGETPALNVPIVRGFSDRELESIEGLVITADVFDWLPRIDDIAPLAKPQNGDVIVWGVFFFEVNSLGGGQDNHRPADEFNLRYRIHTKVIIQPEWLTVPPEYRGADG